MVCVKSVNHYFTSLISERLSSSAMTISYFNISSSSNNSRISGEYSAGVKSNVICLIFEISINVLAKFTLCSSDTLANGVSISNGESNWEIECTPKVNANTNNSLSAALAEPRESELVTL